MPVSLIPREWVVKTFIEKPQHPILIVLPSMYPMPTSHSVYGIIKGRLIGFRKFPIILGLQVIESIFFNTCRHVWQNVELERIEPGQNFVVGFTTSNREHRYSQNWIINVLSKILYKLLKPKFYKILILKYEIHI